VVDGLIGVELAGFRIESELGRGGMGVVYLAEEVALGRVVALKVLAPEHVQDPTARGRFQFEIKSAVAIEHPHVVPIYGAGYEGGQFYLAMRFVRGEDLLRVLDTDGPLSEARALRIVGQIASALHAVHEQGIVHRDIKPQNVLVWNAGEPDEHSFLTDFGIARALDESRRLTQFGALGTRGYMAPELLDGMAPTPACDQFSLACVAFELLTGRLPFGEGTTDTADDEPQDLPLPIVAYAPPSKRVRESIEQALSVDPKERFVDIRAFVAAMDVAHEAFERSRAITGTVATARSAEKLVSELYTSHGLSEEAIAEIADLRKSEVVRLKRQAARSFLVGDTGASPKPNRK
jgi:serine/threonine protein kinase